MRHETNKGWEPRINNSLVADVICVRVVSKFMILDDFRPLHLWGVMTKSKNLI